MKWFLKHDWVLSIITWLLVIIGIVTIYSITYNADKAVYGAGAVEKQLIFAIISLIIYVLIISFLDFSYLKTSFLVYTIYFLILGLLAVIFFVSAANRGSIRWLSIGPLNIEPSELAKLGVILVSSYFLEKRLVKKFTFRNGILLGILLILYLGLIFIQPDLGTTIAITFLVGTIFISSSPNIKNLFIVTITLVLSFFLGIFSSKSYDIFTLLRLKDSIDLISSLRFVFIGTIVAVILSVVFFQRILWKELLISVIVGITVAYSFSFIWNNYILSKPHQKDRIESFINPQENISGSGYQVYQSIIATGSGRLFGRGFGRGTQSNLNFLPERHTDFIFASFAEEFGFAGCVFLIILYMVLIIRIINIGLKSNDNFNFLLCTGIAGMIFFQYVINIGMNIGIMPVTGIPLPLFSYGGSSLLTTIVSIALVQSIAKNTEYINMEDSLINRNPQELT